ncbi:hypothetical protein L3Q82_014441 [Scortum barcoo]|uniref:Uncharacterized protein n=1 Tax=Scortum barcoo TaxID=214431 RepID=A0ACB8VXE4_9TELE|nr:hypothetical protein L3Q82_014441 [Scortum barcoo]
MFSASIVVRGSSKLWTQGLWCLSWWQPPNAVVDTGSKGLWDSRTQLTGTGRPSKPQLARAVLEAKTRVWEEFEGEKQYSANTVGSAGGELLTSIGDIVGRWKEYFEELLNPTETPSSEEVEARDSEVDSSITQAKVTEVVCKLLSGKAPGVDEIRPEYLKSLDVVGLSWLTRLLQHCMERDHTSQPQPPREDLHQGTGEENSADSRPSDCRRNNAVFFLVVEHWTSSSIPSAGCLRVLWEFAQPVHMCFVDLEKAFNRVPRGFLGVARGLEGVQFGNHRISSLLFADDVVLLASSSQDLQHVLERFAAECEAAGMRISTSKSEGHGSRPEKGGVPSLGG